jgi:hypothetical protein
MMEKNAYRPRRKDDYPSYLEGCRLSFSKHRITLMLPNYLKDSEYNLYFEKYHTATKRIVKLPESLPRLVKDAIRDIQAQLK